MTRRTYAVLLATVLVILAGCTGVPGFDGDDTDIDGESPDGPESVETDDDNATGESNETEPGDHSDTDDVTNESGVDPPPGELEIHHIDVGQADSTLLITPDGETILIDTGHWTDDGETVVDYLDRHDIDRIDHLIATHAHADHIGGHAEIITEYETERDGIGTIYQAV